MKRFVYLAGPVLDCTEEGAKSWRVTVANELAAYNLIGISPLRCEPLIGERYQAGHDDPRFGTARAILAKNMFDVQTCDAVLAYLPAPEVLDTLHHSWGTMIELAWAKAFNKMAILVSADPRILAHPVLNSCAGWVVQSLDDAADILAGVLGGYTGGFRNV